MDEVKDQFNNAMYNKHCQKVEQQMFLRRYYNFKIISVTEPFPNTGARLHPAHIIVL